MLRYDVPFAIQSFRAYETPYHFEFKYSGLITLVYGSSFEFSGKRGLGREYCVHIQFAKKLFRMLLK